MGRNGEKDLKCKCKLEDRVGAVFVVMSRTTQGESKYFGNFEIVALLRNTSLQKLKACHA
jgi:hypothetical protein